MKLTRILLEALLEVYARGISNKFFEGATNAINRDEEVNNKASAAYTAIIENSSNVRKLVEDLFILVAEKFIKEVQITMQFKNFPEKIEYLYKEDEDEKKVDKTTLHYRYGYVVAKDDDFTIYATISMELVKPGGRISTPVVIVNNEKTVISYNINSGTEYSQDFRDLWYKGVSRYNIPYSKKDDVSRMGGYERFYAKRSSYKPGLNIADKITSDNINTVIQATNQLSDTKDIYTKPLEELVGEIKILLLQKGLLSYDDAKRGTITTNVNEKEPDETGGKTRIPATASWSSRDMDIQVQTKILKNSKKLSRVSTLVKIAGVIVYRGEEVT